MQADTQDIAALQSLANQDDVAGQYAQNILEFLNVEAFEKEVILPNFMASGKKAFVQEKTATVGYLKLRPNPAATYILVDYDVSYLGEGVIFELISADGRPLLSYRLRGLINEEIIDLNGTKSGNYMCRAMYEGKMYFSGKVVVTE